MLSQASIVQSNLCDFFKYSHLQNDAIKEVGLIYLKHRVLLHAANQTLKYRSESANDYLKCKKATDAKKERYFNLKDITKWEIQPEVLKEIDSETLLSHKPLAFELMFPKVILDVTIPTNLSIGQDTYVEHELRNRFAFFNFETFAHINKTVGRKCKLYMSNFMKFAKEQSENLSNVIYF